MNETMQETELAPTNTDINDVFDDNEETPQPQPAYNATTDVPGNKSTEDHKQSAVPPEQHEEKQEIEEIQSLPALVSHTGNQNLSLLHNVVQQISASLAFLLHQQSDFCENKALFGERCDVFHSQKTQNYLPPNDTELSQQEENLNALHPHYDNMYNAKWPQWESWLTANDATSNAVKYNKTVLNIAMDAINKIDEIKKTYREIKQSLKDIGTEEQRTKTMTWSPVPHSNTKFQANFAMAGSLNDINDEKGMKAWLLNRDIEDRESCDSFQEVQDFAGIETLDKALKSYAKKDVNALKMEVAMNNLAMPKWEWTHVVWWIARIDSLKPFASIFWEWRINGVELCNMDKEKIKLLLRCRHGYREELDTITNRDIDNLLQERDKALLLSVVTFKYETCYKLITLVKHENCKNLAGFQDEHELIQQCHKIYQLLNFLRAQSLVGPKAIWKLNAFYFNKIDNYLAVMIASTELREIFLSADYFSTFMQDLPSNCRDSPVTSSELAAVDIASDDNKYEEKQQNEELISANTTDSDTRMNTEQIQDEYQKMQRYKSRTDLKHGTQRGMIDKVMDTMGGGLKSEFIKRFDRIYLRIILVLLFALSLGCLSTWTWMSRRARSGVETAMRWSTDNIAQRAMQSMEFEFLAPQMLISVVVTGLYNGDITTNAEDYVDNAQFDEFFVQYKAYTVSQDIVYAMYMYEWSNETIIGSYSTSDDECMIFVFNGSCGTEYTYSQNEKQRNAVSANVGSCGFIPSQRPWYDKANELGADGMGFTEPYLFRENEIGMSLVRNLLYNGVEVTFIVEFTTNTLQNVFSSFGSVIGGITYLVTPGGSVIASDIGQVDCVDATIPDCSADDDLLANSVQELRKDLAAMQDGNYSANVMTANDFEMIAYSFKTVWLNTDITEYATIVVAYNNAYLSDIASAEFWTMAVYIFFTLTICIYLCILAQCKQKNDAFEEKQMEMLIKQSSASKPENNTSKLLERIYDYSTVSRCSTWWTLLTFVLVYILWERNVDPNWKETIDVFKKEEYMIVQDKVISYIHVAQSMADIVEQRFQRGDFFLNGADIPLQADVFMANIMESFKGVYNEYYSSMVYVATPDGKFIGARIESDANISAIYGNSLRITVRDNSTDWIRRDFAANPQTLQRANVSNPIQTLGTYDPRCREWYKLSLQYMFDGPISLAFGEYSTFEAFYVAHDVDSGLSSECIDAVRFYTEIWNVSNVSNGASSETNTVFKNNVQSANESYNMLWTQYLFASEATIGLTAMKAILNSSTGELLAVVAIDFTMQPLSDWLNVTESADWYSWIMRSDTFEMVAASDGQVTVPLGGADDECVTITGTCYDISNILPYNATTHPNYFTRVVSQEISLFYTGTASDALAINTSSSPTHLRLPLDLPDAFSGRIMTYPHNHNPVELDWIVVTVMDISSIKISEEDDTKIIGFILAVTFYAIYRIQSKIHESACKDTADLDVDGDIETHTMVIDENRYDKLKHEMEPLLRGAASQNWKAFVETFDSKIGNHLITTSMATDFMAKQSNQHIETQKDGDLTFLLYSLQDNRKIYGKILYFLYSKTWNHFMNLIIVIHLATSMWLPENPQLLTEKGFEERQSRRALSIIVFLIVIEIIDVIVIGIARYIEFGALSANALEIVTKLKYGPRHEYVKQMATHSTAWLIFFGGAYYRRFIIHIALLLLIIINVILMVTLKSGPFEYYVPLVPILLIIRSERIRQFSIQLAHATLLAKEILISYMMLILIVSILASAVFADILNPSESVDTFASSIRALITSFVFVSTGENYNEIVYSAIDKNFDDDDGGVIWFNVVQNTVSVVNLLFFVIVSVVGLFFFIPVMIFKFESTFDHSRKANDNIVSRKKLSAKINLLIAAFIWLDMDDTGKISENEFKLLVHSSIISRTVLLDAFDYDDYDEVTGAKTEKYDEISLYEFVSTLINGSSFSFTVGINSKDCEETTQHNNVRTILECNFFRRSRNRHYILVYLIIPSVCVALFRGLASLGDTNHAILSALIHIFFILNFLEINLRWYAFGRNRYFSLIQYKNPKKVQQAMYNWTTQRSIRRDSDFDDQILQLSHAEKQWVWQRLLPIKPQTLWQQRTLSEIHKAELYLIWFSFAGIISTFIAPNLLSGYYYLFIQLYLFRLFTLVAANLGLIALVFTIIPHTLNILAFLFIFMFFYARIGCTLFGFKTDFVVEDVYKSNANANFNTLGSSILTLMQLMIGEGWHEIMYLNMIATRVEHSLYFIVYIVVVTLIISNIFIGLFLSEIEDLDQEQAQDEFLSEWMDSITSNTKRNSKIIAQKRKNKLINQLNELNQAIKNTKKQIKKVEKIITDSRK